MKHLVNGETIRIEPLAPFDALLLNGEYMVTSQTLIPELQKAKIDVFKEVYEPFALTKQDMQDDIANKVSIVSLSLKAGLSKTLTIPSNRFNIVNLNDRMYSEKAIAVRIGNLPDEENFESLLVEIEQLIKSRLGLVVKSVVKKISKPFRVSLENHIEIKAERDLNRDTNLPYDIIIAQLRTRIDILEKQNNALKIKLTQS